MIPTNRYNRLQQQQRSRKFMLYNNHGSVFKIAVCLVIGLVLGGTISLLCFWTLGNTDQLFGEQVSVAHAVLRRSSSMQEMEGTQQQEQHHNIRGGDAAVKEKDTISLTVKEQPVPVWKQHQGEEPAATVSETKKQRTIPFQRKKDQKKKDPISVDQVIDFLSNYLHLLHEKMALFKDTKTHVEIWDAFYDITKETLYPWDLEYKKHMPRRRQDGSIFLSLASYRDENCVHTLSGAFANAKHPSQLFVGLVQQNCVSNCQSGVLEGGKVMDVEPDVDCHAVFCASPQGKPHCEAGRVRTLFVEESESLGPYMARYFASKLWSGEEWFLQIDAHMSFAQDWDDDTLTMLQAAPSKKPVISHYPPDEDTDFQKARNMPAPRICVPEFANSGIEEHIVRLEGSGVYDHERIDTPRFAPFVAAGYFAAHSDFLKEVPFDPFLPWIFMGEEIIMSARLWTSGYDIFSPTHSVLGHIYIRRHKPKFWESVGRLFQPGIHNPLQRLVLQRVKTQLLYPESQANELKTKSLLFALENYTMGTERSLKDYLEMVGLDPTTKKVTNTKWCQQGMPPFQFQHLNHLYQKRQPEQLKKLIIPHKVKADAEQLGNDKEKTADKTEADHDDSEGKGEIGAAADGDTEQAKGDTKVQKENTNEKEEGAGKAGDVEEANKGAEEPSDDDDDDTEEKQEEKQSSDEQVTDGDIQAAGDTEEGDKDVQEPTGDDDDDKEEQSDAKEENVVGDTEEQAKEKDGQASDTEEQAKEKDEQASDTEEGDEDAEEPTGDDDDKEEQVEGEDGHASDTEEQAKEEEGQASDTEEQAKEEDGQGSDTEEQSKEEDGQASDAEEQAKEEDGQGSDAEEQAKEEDGQGSDTEEQAKQGDGSVDEEEGGGNDTEGSKEGEPDAKEEEKVDDNDSDQDGGEGDDDAEGQEEGGDDDAEGQEEQEKAAEDEKPEAIERRALLKNRVKLEVDD